MKPLAYLMSPEKPPFPGSWRQQRHQFKTGSDQCFLHGKYRGIVTKQTTSVFISITLVSVLLQAALGREAKVLVRSELIQI